MVHSRRTSGPGAAAARWHSFVTNAVLIERAVSCWHLHQLISQTTQYLDSWLSDLLQSELKIKLLEVEGGMCPMAGDATDFATQIFALGRRSWHWLALQRIASGWNYGTNIATDGFQMLNSEHSCYVRIFPGMR